MKLTVDKLSMERGEELIFTGVSFDIAAGDALIIGGTNGVGKSTLLRGLCGLLPIGSGAVTIDNPDPEFADHDVGQLCHYLGPDNAMKPSMSVRENLDFWQGFCGHPHLEIDEATQMVGLAGLEDVPFAHLSTGQRRRIAIARLLVSYRPIWLLDEPTSGLDAASQSQFEALMAAHLDDDGIILAVTHVPLSLNKARSMTLSMDGLEPSDLSKISAEQNG